MTGPQPEIPSRLLEALGLDSARHTGESIAADRAIRFIMDIIPVAFVYMEQSRLVIQYNPAFAKIMGIPAAHSGQPLQTVLGGFPPMLTLFEKTLADQEDYRSRLVHFERSYQLVHLLVDAKVMMIGDKPEGWLFVCREIDNLPTIEAQIVRNDKLATAGKIAAGIAHEIRNPLTSIRGFLQLLESDLMSSDTAKHQVYIGLMLAEIDRVNQLVNQMLMLTKSAAIVLETLAAGQVLEEVAAIVRAEALLRNTAVQIMIQEAPPIRADRNMLRQVLLNLISNALDAMEGGGVLTLAAEYDPVASSVRINVTDTGPGIPAYMVDRIFDAFFTMKEHGTGLGLAICQRIVADLGGEIRVFSKGFGTTFSVLLPALKE
ncbi:MAG: two-component system sensor histidine kinase NtrB [Bacilli bacterium]